MQNRALEIFYLFFQGILSFQILFFGVLYFITRRVDILYYSLFLFFAAAYFFINAPYTFFGIPEDTVWNSIWYDYVNTPIIIIENLFYLLFLKSFFEDIVKDKMVTLVFRFILLLIPLMLALFILLTALQMNKQFIFYTVKLISVVPALAVAYIILQRKLPFSSIVAKGLLCTIIGTCITVGMIVLRNLGVHHLFTDGYPLFFIRLGILGDMIFFMAAILKKWHFQEKQLAVEQLQSQLEVEKLRNKISGELHDDLGATLSGINMYSYMVNDLLVDCKYEQAKQSVNIIQKSVNQMVFNLNDLVWAIKPNEDTFQKLIERLEDYASEMASVKDIKINITLTDAIDQLQLPVESKRNIYLICKEAINNAVKYSSATLLELTVKEINGKLEFKVSDNGKGFDLTSVKRGNGLLNMQKRADEIGAILKVYSNKNEGTSVMLQYKIT